jgi:hypothetical protein
MNDDEDEDNDIIVFSRNCIQSKSLFTSDHAKNLLEEVSLRKFQETRKIIIGTNSSPKYVNLGVDSTIDKVD